MRAQMTRGLSWLRSGGACAVVAMAMASLGCGSSGSNEPTKGGSEDASLDGTMTMPTEGGSGDDASDAGTISEGGGVFESGTPCDPDASVDIDCTGRCGPVRDACTGTVKMCGGCMPVMAADAGPDAGDAGMEVRVCDLSTNTCVKPKVTCADLGAQCGTVRDSCGDFLDCPDTNPKGCPAGQECNPDTNQCQDCESVTCADLGYECGFAWLGCGPDTESNYTDCGGCAPDADGGARVCNTTFNNCEPACKPASAAVICAAAQAKSGVNCGFISDGCGGIVECDSNVPGFGCATGQSCGVRGIANHCDPYETPDECVALGRNCGDITSSCTGLKIHCGDCATGQVCNANGVCGPPCTAMTCADYPQAQCGTFPDGCGSTITCGTCPGGVCDQTTNTCCPVKQCGTDYAGQCGTALPNGCGQNTDSCSCATGTCTADGGAATPPAAGATGQCCVPHTLAFYSGQNQCGTNLPDGCGHTITVTCPTGEECVANSTGSPGPAPANGVVGMCCTRTDTCNLDAGSCGAIQDSCRPAGTTYTCNKCTAGTSCMNNGCCTPAPACTGNGLEGAECNDSKQPVTPGCGSARTCNCAGGRVCWCTDHVCGASDGTGACKTSLTCSSTTYSGKCGTALDNGTGGTITCGCPSGQVCSTSTAGATGTCQCNNPTGKPYTCANVPGGPGQAGGDACGTYNDGCGGTLTCNCTGGLSCNTTPNPNVCCAGATCPTQALGSACGAVSNGCTTVNCGCPSGTGNENFTCTAGKCACTPDTCRGRTGAQPDRCGGTLNCGG